MIAFLLLLSLVSLVLGGVIVLVLVTLVLVALVLSAAKATFPGPGAAIPKDPRQIMNANIKLMYFLTFDLDMKDPLSEICFALFHVAVGTVYEACQFAFPQRSYDLGWITEGKGSVRDHRVGCDQTSGTD